MNVFDYVRFDRQTPPSVPPEGQVDLKFDPDTGSFVQVNPDGTSSTVGTTTEASVKEISGTSYTLLEGDSGKVLYFTSGSAVTVTVPSGLPVGFNVALIQSGAGTVTVAAGGGTTVNSMDALVEIAGQHGAVSLISLSANVFNLSGALA